MIDTPAARQFVHGIAAAMVSATTCTSRTRRSCRPRVGRGPRWWWPTPSLRTPCSGATPALADDLALLTDPERALALDGVQASLIARGWEHVSRSRMLLPPAGGLIAAGSSPAIAVQPGLDGRSIDTSRPADRSMMDTFAASLSADEREEADLDGGEYDDHILAVVEVDGIRRP